MEAKAQSPSWTAPALRSQLRTKASISGVSPTQLQCPLQFKHNLQRPPLHSTLAPPPPRPHPTRCLSSSRPRTSACLPCRPAALRTPAQTWSAPYASASSTTSSAVPRCSSANTRSAWSAWPASTSSRLSPAPSSARFAGASRHCLPSGYPDWPPTQTCCPACQPPCRESTASASSAAKGSCRSKGQQSELI